MALPECECDIQVVEYYTSTDARGNDIHIIHSGDCPYAMAVLKQEEEMDEAIVAMHYEEWISNGGADED